MLHGMAGTLVEGPRLARDRQMMQPSCWMDVCACKEREKEIDR
jgi:hypothetical protein